MTWCWVVQDPGGEALYLQSEPNDTGRVGQHAVQNIEQGEEQRSRCLVVVLIVHIQAQCGGFSEQVTDMADQSCG